MNASVNFELLNELLVGFCNFDVNLLTVSSSRKHLESIVLKLREVYQNFSMLESFVEPNIRYCDYFSYELDYKGNMEYAKMLGMESAGFSLYGLQKSLETVAELFLTDEICESKDEAYEYLDGSTELTDVLSYATSVTNFIYQRQTEIADRKEVELPFLTDDVTYKIFFEGHSLEDVKDLQKPVVLQAIKKINEPLARQVRIKLAEGIDHVREKYDIPIMRIQFANDYRIAYIRRNNVTIILGLGMKSGKDSDYTRYDSVAERIDDIYALADEFEQGELPQNHSHYEVIDILQKAYIDKKKKSK